MAGLVNYNCWIETILTLTIKLFLEMINKMSQCLKNNVTQESFLECDYGVDSLSNIVPKEVFSPNWTPVSMPSLQTQARYLVMSSPVRLRLVRYSRLPFKTVYRCFCVFYTGLAPIEGRWILLFILFWAHSRKRTMNFFLPRREVHLYESH